MMVWISVFLVAPGTLPVEPAVMASAITPGFQPQLVRKREIIGLVTFSLLALA